MKLKKPIKWYGGKEYLAKRIIELMPEHTHYVEPFFGGGSVLFAKDPTKVSEVANDIFGSLTNFWKTLSSEEHFETFQRKVSTIPFSEIAWTESLDLMESEDQVERAVGFFVRCRQSRMGMCKDFATLSRNRTRRGMNEQASSWWGAIEGLPDAHARLKRVVILNRKAVDVIKQQDGENTLFYLDPPYLHETRTTLNSYQFEMSEDDHKELLKAIKACKGKVLLSGYPSDLYTEELKSWNCEQIEIDNKASTLKKKPKEIECLWMNY